MGKQYLRVNLSAARPYALCGEDNTKAVILIKLEAQGLQDVGGQKAHLLNILDCSGSMAGSKIEQVKSAIVDELAPLARSDDLVSVVTFETHARNLGTFSHAERKKLAKAVTKVSAGGTTHISRGMREALKLASKEDCAATRVILLTDGQPTESMEDVNKAAETFRSKELPVTCVGTDDFDENVLSAIADVTGGRVFMLKDLKELKDVLQDEMFTAQEPFLESVEVRVECIAGRLAWGSIVYPDIIVVEHGGREFTAQLGNIHMKHPRLILVEIEVPRATRPGKERVLQVSASFDLTAVGLKGQSVAEEMLLEFTTDKDRARALDPEVRRFYNSLQVYLKSQEAVELADKGQAERAEGALEAALSMATSSNLDSRKTVQVALDNLRTRKALNREDRRTLKLDSRRTEEIRR